ncbi:MAG: hypothetical protein M1823_004831 [Watsoniomyces obsoletus]|nr:MAG: hypothetical protein M1823_004831 [Watsoniomyces obsoletus]
MRTDPRLRQTWNTISSNLESANESAQVNLFTFTQRYIQPCFSNLNGCLTSVTGPCTTCFYSREERLRRSRLTRAGGGGGGGRGRGGVGGGRSGSRAEYNFDFYDDWDTDDFGATSDGLLNLGNDELDRLLVGSGTGTGTTDTGKGHQQQPKRPRAMSYGARRDHTKVPRDNEPDSTIIPSSSLFGLFGRLPFKLGGGGGGGKGKGLRYKPSAADLQDRSTSSTTRRAGSEVEPLLEDHEDGDEEGGEHNQKRHERQKRARSDTTGSDSVSDSIRSRADLFPSDDEADAVPLDDEFAMGLERRMTTGSGMDTETQDSRGRDGKERGSRKTTSSRTSTRTQSSQEAMTRTHSSQEAMTSTEKRQRRRSGSTGLSVEVEDIDREMDPDIEVAVKTPSLADLKKEEEAVQREEEEEVERKRVAASRLAAKRGLSGDGQSENRRVASSSPPPSLTSTIMKTTTTNALQDRSMKLSTEDEVEPDSSRRVSHSSEGSLGDAAVGVSPPAAESALENHDSHPPPTSSETLVPPPATSNSDATNELPINDS